MKTIIFIATVIILAAARPDGENAEIVKSELINDGVNPWHHSLELTSGVSQEATGQIVRQGEEDESIAVRGSYSHKGPDGVTYVVQYIADDNGFHSKIARQ